MLPHGARTIGINITFWLLNFHFHSSDGTKWISTIWNDDVFITKMYDIPYKLSKCDMFGTHLGRSRGLDAFLNRTTRCRFLDRVDDCETALRRFAIQKCKWWWRAEDMMTERGWVWYTSTVSNIFFDDPFGPAKNGFIFDMKMASFDQSGAPKRFYKSFEGFAE